MYTRDGIDWFEEAQGQMIKNMVNSYVKKLKSDWEAEHPGESFYDGPY